MKRIEWANTLRGVAVAAVLIAHLIVAFWLNQAGVAGLARRPALYDDPSMAPRWAHWVGTIPVEFAAFGVALFFLLSGYVIAISLTRYSRRGFLVGRLTRIVPTFAAGYLVTCLVVWTAGDPGAELKFPELLVGMVPGLPWLLHTAAPADGIVWTIVVEIAFYGVCLIVFRALVHRWQAIVGVAVACMVIQPLLTPFTPPPFLSGIHYIVLLACPFIPIMLIGMTLSPARGEGHSVTARVALVLALAGAYWWLASTTSVVPTPLRYRWSFLLAVLVFAAVLVMGGRWQGSRSTDFMAAISYPLYVVHAVLGYFLLSLLAAHGVPPWLDLLIVTAVAIGCAWLIHVTVETPTHQVGKRWARRLSDPRGPSEGGSSA